MTSLDAARGAPGPAVSAPEESGPWYSYAFQPIVDTAAGEVVAYEALVRGSRGEPARDVFARVAASDLHRFDRESRALAVTVAGRLGIACALNLNVLPQSLTVSATDRHQLLEAAARSGVPLERVVLEITETEAIVDLARFAEAIDEFRGLGMRIAIDDFGAGHSGLNLLADFQPDTIKLDMNLVRGIEGRGPRQSIVRAIAMVCDDLGIDVIVEGVETLDEFRWFEQEGLRLFQGHLFGRPGFERLPTARYPDDARGEPSRS